MTSGRPSSHNNNNNNHSKSDSAGEDPEGSTARGNCSRNSRKNDSESSTTCSECPSDSDSSGSASQLRGHNDHAKKKQPQRTKKRTKTKGSKESKAGGDGGRSSSSSGSGSESSDDDDDDDSEVSSDSGASEDESQRSTAPKKVTTKAKSPPPKPQQQQPLTSLAQRGHSLSDDDEASSSGMDMPDLAAAIQRAVESVSDSESGVRPAPMQYTSSLLHDFNMKTQLMGECTEIERLSSAAAAASASITADQPKDDKSESIPSPRPLSAASTATSTTTTTTAPVARKRGRPRKNPPASVDLTAAITSESPDSGIISTPHSPVQPDKRSALAQQSNAGKGKGSKSQSVSDTSKSKLTINNLEKSMYATERVLYPPRRKRHDTTTIAVGMPPATTPTDEILDPAWREIDINHKFRRPSVSGYKSDGGNTVCSRILAANCDYLSDYGNVNNERSGYSGYKSDYSCKSRRSGYRSDYSVKARSCGYRSDCSTKHRRKVRRKRRTKTAASKPSVNEQDLLMLAGLSLGQSEPSDESSRDSVLQPVATIPEHSVARKRPMFRRKTFSGALATTTTSRSAPSTASRDLLNSLCDRVTKRISGLEDDAKSVKPILNESVNMSTFAGLYKDKTGGAVGALKLNSDRVGMIRSRRSSAISHCSSHYSVSSRHPFRKRRRRRLKSISRSDNSPAVNISKINLQIEQLIASFPTSCAIIGEKTNKENAGVGKTAGGKRAVKKRKGSDNVEAPAVTPTATTKRRHKKAAQVESPDDHKLPSSLPLKKRYYLVTPEKKASEKSAESKSGQTPSTAVEKGDKQKADDTKSIPKAAANKAVTPKKRHLQETTPAIVEPVTDVPATSDKANRTTTDGLNGKVTATSRKAEPSSRKKNRNTEPPAQKPQPPAPFNNRVEKTVLTEPQTKGSASRISVVRSNFIDSGPPPGVFEPSVDLELQIPFVSISIPSMHNKSEFDSPRSDGTAKSVSNDSKVKGRVVEKLLKSTGAHALLKRKRKKPNRTGFPTLKKKKKPVVVAEAPAAASNTIKLLDPPVVPDTLPNCDRVPTPGEPTKSFIERNDRPRLSVISLEKLQGKAEAVKSPVTDVSKRLRDNSKERLPANLKKFRQTVVAELSEDDVPLLNRITATRNKTRGDKKAIEATATPIASEKTASSKRAVVRLEISEKVNQMAIGQEKKKGRNVEVDSAPSDNQSTMVDTKRKRGRPSKAAVKEQSDTNPPKDGNDISAEKEVSKESLAIEIIPTKKSKSSKSETKGASAPPKAAATGKQKVTEGKTASKAKASVDSPAVDIKSKKINAATKIPSEPAEKPQTKPGKTSKSDADKRKVEEKSKPSLLITKASQKQNHTEKSSKSDKNKPTEKAAIDDEKEKEKSSASKKSEKPTKTTIVSKRKGADVAVDAVKETNVPLDDDYEFIEAEMEPYDETKCNRLEDDPLPSPYIDPPATDAVEVLENQDSRKPLVKSRKKYLPAGLFSNYFKEHHVAGDKSSRSTTSDHEHPATLLPAPAYCEKYIRQTEYDFQLPYDLWWAHENEKLPGRNVIQSWNFKKIRTNVYYDIRANPSSDHQPCCCKPESACGDDCLNRMVYTECNPETCPCQDKCQNTKIQRHIIAPGVERFMTTNKGWGVQAKLPITKGTYILEYVGEVVAEREFKERMATLYARDIHHYCLHLDGGLVIDGQRMGSDCRFVNHSCSPNCEMQKWSVNGLSRMALFALRNIQPGEELTYDYNFSLFNPAEGQPCKCETRECRGVIGGKSQRVRPIEPKAGGDKAQSNKKERSGRPTKGGTSKGRTFMHSKDVTKMNVFQLPTPKEQGLIAGGHCFLLRNLKKVSLIFCKGVYWLLMMVFRVIFRFVV